MTISIHIPTLIFGFIVGFITGGYLTMLILDFLEEKYSHKMGRVNFSRGWEYGYQRAKEEFEKDGKI